MIPSGNQVYYQKWQSQSLQFIYCWVVNTIRTWSQSHTESTIRVQTTAQYQHNRIIDFNELFKYCETTREKHDKRRLYNVLATKALTLFEAKGPPDTPKFLDFSYSI